MRGYIRRKRLDMSQQNVGCRGRNHNVALEPLCGGDGEHKILNRWLNAFRGVKLINISHDERTLYV